MFSVGQHLDVVALERCMYNYFNWVLFIIALSTVLLM